MKLIYAKSARKDLDDLSEVVITHVRKRLQLLEEDAVGLQIKKLKGTKSPQLYRLRVGDFRVIYTVNRMAKEITLLRVVHRKDAYQP